MTRPACCDMMVEVVRLRDLGGGEQNDALTWALFDESADDADQDAAADAPEDPGEAGEPVGSKVTETAGGAEAQG